MFAYQYLVIKFFIFLSRQDWKREFMSETNIYVVKRSSSFPGTTSFQYHAINRTHLRLFGLLWFWLLPISCTTFVVDLASKLYLKKYKISLFPLINLLLNLRWLNSNTGFAVTKIAICYKSITEKDSNFLI